MGLFTKFLIISLVLSVSEKYLGYYSPIFETLAAESTKQLPQLKWHTTEAPKKMNNREITKYNEDNYLAECPIRTPIGDENLGETSVVDIKDQNGAGDVCLVPIKSKKPCQCLPAIEGEKDAYLNQEQCDNNVDYSDDDLLHSQCPNAAGVLDAECTKCSVTHPPNAKKLMIHCTGCKKASTLPIEDDGNLLLIVKYLELPQYN